MSDKLPFVDALVVGNSHEIQAHDKLKFVGQNMIAFFFIIGTHFFSWGSEPVPDQMRCSKCGTVGTFVKKQGMRFITLFFIVPLIPISGVKTLLQCSVCGTKFQIN